MSDPYAQRNQARRLEQTQVIERPSRLLFFAQQALNPFPLASSGGAWGDLGLPWPVNVRAFYASVFVATTNDGTNFWTLTLTSYPSATAMASVSTSAIAAATFTRLSDLTITQPASTDAWVQLIATATGAPGAIYIGPALAVLS